MHTLCLMILLKMQSYNKMKHKWPCCLSEQGIKAHTSAMTTTICMVRNIPFPHWQITIPLTYLLSFFLNADIFFEKICFCCDCFPKCCCGCSCCGCHWLLLLLLSLSSVWMFLGTYVDEGDVLLLQIWVYYKEYKYKLSIFCSLAFFVYYINKWNSTLE